MTFLKVVLLSAKWPEVVTVVVYFCCSSFYLFLLFILDIDYCFFEVCLFFQQIAYSHPHDLMTLLSVFKLD